MLQNTRGIVLRPIRYGETSLVVTIFTALYGLQTYMVQGVRSTKIRSNRAGFFQPASLLDMVVYRQPQKSLQRLREFQPAHIYNSLQGEVVKNSVALFSVELLLRLLQEDAPMPELFDFTYDYFVQLDVLPADEVANFPLYFIIHCSRFMGYEVKGNYSAATPYLNLNEGGYSDHMPASSTSVTDDDAKALNLLMDAATVADLKDIGLNAGIRFRLLDWYIEFLQRHTQHMGAIKSLTVLRAVLH